MDMMKKLFLTFILMLSTFAATAFQKDLIETGTFNNKAIYGYDTVAYFTQNMPVAGNDDISSEWRGAIWHFSSQENKQLFEESPQKYAPQYGGHCAYAMSKGRFVGIDEEAFTILNDKLYLNYSKGVQEDWLENVDSFIEMADKEYSANVGL
ncbi:MAG: YHS domain-containing protein [Glaciecola sp.]|jgi:YHS domain-containing protein